MVRKNGDRLTSKETRERREREIKFIQKYGWWNFVAADWAKKEGVSESAINDDKRWIKDHVVLDIIDQEDIKFELHHGLKEVVKQARLKALTSDSEALRTKWTNTYANLVDRFSKFLVDFGVIDPVTGKLRVEHEGGKDITPIVIEVLRKHGREDLIKEIYQQLSVDEKTTRMFEMRGATEPEKL